MSLYKNMFCQCAQVLIATDSLLQHEDDSCTLSVGCSMHTHVHKETLVGRKESLWHTPKALFDTLVKVHVHRTRTNLAHMCHIHPNTIHTHLQDDEDVVLHWKKHYTYHTLFAVQHTLQFKGFLQSIATSRSSQQASATGNIHSHTH